MSYARCIVATKSNVTIAEISPDVDYISWRLNKVGKAKFSLSKSDTKATEDILRFGNRILFEFDNGLPNWGGMIDPPRNWDEGLIKCMAFSAEKIFQYRQTDKGRYFSGDTVGSIFTKLIKEANEVSNMGVTPGDVWEGGTGHSPEYHYKSLLDIFQDSITKSLSDADFDVTATMTDGSLIFKANLYETKGTTKTGVALVEGTNITGMKVSEQGPIVNAWDVAGGGFGWGDSRPSDHAENAASIDQYGLRQDSKIFPSVSLQSTVTGHAKSLLDETKEPFNEYSLDVLDVAPGIFASYDVGDYISLLSHTYGFNGIDTVIRVLEREYRPGQGECYLAVEERN